MIPQSIVLLAFVGTAMARDNGLRRVSETAQWNRKLNTDQYLFEIVFKESEHPPTHQHCLEKTIQHKMADIAQSYLVEVKGYPPDTKWGKVTSVESVEKIKEQEQNALKKELETTEIDADKVFKATESTLKRNFENALRKAEAFLEKALKKAVDDLVREEKSASSKPNKDELVANASKDFERAEAAAKDLFERTKKEAGTVLEMELQEATKLREETVVGAKSKHEKAHNEIEAWANQAIKELERRQGNSGDRMLRRRKKSPKRDRWAVEVRVIAECSLCRPDDNDSGGTTGALGWHRMAYKSTKDFRMWMEEGMKKEITDNCEDTKGTLESVHFSYVD